MKDEQILNGLFELARHETPQRSLEEVETVFRKNLSLQSAFTSAQFLPHISLNQFVLLLISGIVLSYLLFNSLNSSIETDEKLQRPGSKISAPVILDSALVAPQLVESKDETKTVTPASALKLPSKAKPPKTEAREKKNKNQKDSIPKSESLESPAFIPLRSDSILTEETGKKPEEDLEKYNPLHSGKTINLILRREDNLGEVNYFNDVLEKYGLNIKARAKFSNGDEFLAEYFCHFKHSDGLNFKLFGSGFDQLEIKLNLSPEGKVIHFSYRFNQESFTRNIPLKLKGNKSYFYGKGFSGKSGTTNIKIEN